MTRKLHVNTTRVILVARSMSSAANLDDVTTVGETDTAELVSAAALDDVSTSFAASHVITAFVFPDFEFIYWVGFAIVVLEPLASLLVVSSACFGPSCLIGVAGHVGVPGGVARNSCTFITRPTCYVRNDR